ncbi:MAG: hypothetical protein QM772_10660 [Ottowia sp.]|uniref:hypothetical protein n=1 Tax=Ottowia sp. TaxID=1898956 RepID=UPI0039E5F651
MSLTLFSNVHVLDVRAGRRLEDHHVRVEGNTVREVSDRPIATTAARVIDGRGRTLMPGLIDCHVHVTFSQTNLGLLADMPDTTLEVLQSASLIGAELLGQGERIALVMQGGVVRVDRRGA